jgi:chromosome segregation ATPase
VVEAAEAEIERLRAQLAEDADVRTQIDHRLEELVGQVDALTAERDEAICGNHRSNEYEPTWAELTGVWKARAEAAEKELQEMQAHIDHADAYHKAMLAAEAETRMTMAELADWTARAEAAEADNARLLNDLKVISQFQATTSCTANIYSIWKMTERARAALNTGKETK